MTYYHVYSYRSFGYLAGKRKKESIKSKLFVGQNHSIQTNKQHHHKDNKMDLWNMCQQQEECVPPSSPSTPSSACSITSGEFSWGWDQSLLSPGADKRRQGIASIDWMYNITATKQDCNSSNEQQPKVLPRKLSASKILSTHLFRNQS
jgi:hypothetical protein